MLTNIKKFRILLFVVKWSVGLVGLGRIPVTDEITSSSLVRTVCLCVRLEKLILCLFILIIYRKIKSLGMRLQT